MRIDMRKVHQLICGVGLILALSASAATTFRFKGTVVDAEGRAVDGATVESYPGLGGFRSAGEELKAEQVGLTTNGAFELQLPRQGALLLARKPGLAPVWRQVRNVSFNGEERLSLSRPSFLAGLV